MAIAFVSATLSAANTQNAASITTSTTVPSGNNRLMVVATHHRDFSAERTVSSITFGGTALTKVRHDTRNPGGPIWRTELWYLIAPAVSTADVVVNWNVGPNEAQAYTVILLTGCHQSSPIHTSNGASGNSLTTGVSVTTSIANTLLLDNVIGRDDSGIFILDSRSARSNRLIATNITTEPTGVGTSAQASAATVNLRWQMFQSFDWVQSAMAIREAVAASSITADGSSYSLSGQVANFATASPLYLRHRK